VIFKPNGQCDAKKMTAHGVWEPLLDGIEDVHVAGDIARASLAGNAGVVWYRHEAEPDSAMTPF
jgi:hypothetical protein